MGKLNDRITGRTKQMAGIVTNNKKLEAEGHAQEAKGQIKAEVTNKINNVSQAINNSTKKGDEK